MLENRETSSSPAAGAAPSGPEWIARAESSPAPSTTASTASLSTAHPASRRPSFIARLVDRGQRAGGGFPRQQRVLATLHTGPGVAAADQRSAYRPRRPRRQRSRVAIDG